MELRGERNSRNNASARTAGYLQSRTSTSKTPTRRHIFRIFSVPRCRPRTWRKATTRPQMPHIQVRPPQSRLVRGPAQIRSQGGMYGFARNKEGSTVPSKSSPESRKEGCHLVSTALPPQQLLVQDPSIPRPGANCACWLSEDSGASTSRRPSAPITYKAREETRPARNDLLRSPRCRQTTRESSVAMSGMCRQLLVGHRIGQLGSRGVVPSAAGRSLRVRAHYALGYQ
jgi:hypothetical protein